MQIIIMTSDHYLFALKPFMYLFNKYFIADYPVKPLICGFTEPDFKLEKPFEFYSIGQFSDYPVKKWSDSFIHVLDEVCDEVFLFMLEDYWLTRYVNTEALRILYDYMHQFRYVVKMDLLDDRLYALGVDKNYGTVSYIDLIKSMPGSEYHLSLMCGFWNRDLMKQVIIPDETPWQIELQGTPRLAHRNDMIVLGTKQRPLHHTLAYRGGDPTTPPDLSQIQEEDIRILKEKGFID